MNKNALAFVAAATTEQLARFIWVLNNRPAYRVPVSLRPLMDAVNNELIARTEWSV